MVDLQIGQWLGQFNFCYMLFKVMKKDAALKRGRGYYGQLMFVLIFIYTFIPIVCALWIVTI